jgi:hypothetical protein
MTSFIFMLSDQKEQEIWNVHLPFKFSNEKINNILVL